MKEYVILQLWTWLVCTAVQSVTIALLLWAGSRDEKWSLRLTAGGRGRLVLLCLLQVLCIERIGGAGGATELISWKLFLWEKTGWSIFAGCLLTAAVMDWWEQMVYRFVWWAAGAAAGMLLLYGTWENNFPRNKWEIWVALAVFVLLQELFFDRFYGRADCHAFCVCAAMLTAQGLGFRYYMAHMTLVFGALALIQLMRGNIARSGRLKIPVPLVPYIVAAFWFLVDFTVRR